jgi:ubiquinone/menaquinone biosynthesis C-methylase UbiE
MGMLQRLERLEAFDSFFEEVHRTIVRNEIQPSPDAKALDIGCGAGGMSVMLAEALTRGVVVALDPDGQHLRHTRRLARQANCAQRIVCSLGDVQKLHFIGSEFDLVWCSRVIHHHLPDPQLALSEIYRVLKPGGRLFLRENANIDLKAMTPIAEADDEWWQRMDSAQQRWFQSKFGHRRPSSDEWLERLRRAGFQNAIATVLQYTPSSARSQVIYLRRWAEGILENEESSEYGDLLDHDDLRIGEQLIDYCKEQMCQPDDKLQGLDLQISVLTQICRASK